MLLNSSSRIDEITFDSEAILGTEQVNVCVKSIY